VLELILNDAIDVASYHHTHFTLEDHISSNICFRLFDLVPVASRLEHTCSRSTMVCIQSRAQQYDSKLVTIKTVRR